MARSHALMLAIIALAQVAAGSARADIYPVSGLWTYRNPAAPGPANSCDKPTMQFVGNHRWDGWGGVPDYRNVAVEQTDPTSFVLNDEFLTWPNVRGNVFYRLYLIDEDHIQIYIPMAGTTIRLRRCV